MNNWFAVLVNNTNIVGIRSEAELNQHPACTVIAEANSAPEALHLAAFYDQDAPTDYKPERLHHGPCKLAISVEDQKEAWKAYTDNEYDQRFHVVLCAGCTVGIQLGATEPGSQVLASFADARGALHYIHNVLDKIDR